MPFSRLPIISVSKDLKFIFIKIFDFKLYVKIKTIEFDRSKVQPPLFSFTTGNLNTLEPFLHAPEPRKVPLSSRLLFRWKKAKGMWRHANEALIQNAPPAETKLSFCCFFFLRRLLLCGGEFFLDKSSKAKVFLRIEAVYQRHEYFHDKVFV